MTTVNKRKIVILSFATAISLTSMAQQVIRGTIRSRTDRLPVSFASIGLKNIPASTITETDGSFSLVIPDSALLDTLLVSSLGFGTQSIPLTQLVKGNKVELILDGKIKTLRPAFVSTIKTRPKTITLGNRDVTGGEYEPDTVYSGRSIAILIDTAGLSKKIRFPVYAGLARLKILRNNLDRCRFRIRIYEVDAATGLPGNELLQQNLIVESGLRRGWLEFDLASVDLSVDGPFYLCFEQLLGQADRAAIADGYREFISKYPERLKVDTLMINGKPELSQRLLRGGIDLPGTFIAMSGAKPAREAHRTVTRETSFAEWKISGSILTATVQLAEAPGLLHQLKVTCDTADALCAARNYLQGQMEEGNIPGMQVAVSVNGKTMLSDGFGFASLDQERAVSVNTIFRINSVSKTFTAVALMKLVSQGKLALDAPVQDYLPAFPLKNYPVTMRQSMGHLAGFRDYAENSMSDYIRTKHYSNATEALEVFKSDALLFPPGSQFHYSPFGINLAGAVIEQITGMDYPRFLGEAVFKRLGMDHSFADGEVPDTVTGSRYYDITGQENSLGDLSYKYPAGGMVSNCTDLLKFGNALLNGELLPANWIDSMMTSQHTSAGTPTGYGIGWYTGSDGDGNRIWYHSGDSFSGSSGILIYPDQKVVVAFLANSQAGVRVDLQKIAKPFLVSGHKKNTVTAPE